MNIFTAKCQNIQRSWGNKQKLGLFYKLNFQKTAAIQKKNGPVTSNFNFHILEDTRKIKNGY